MRYKVGDLVKVREDLVVETYYGGCMFTKSMNRYKGKQLTISSLHSDNYIVLENIFYWSDEMLEDVKKEAKEEHNCCEFSNDYLYSSFTTETGSIAFNKVKVVNVSICDNNGEKLVAIVNYNERIDESTKVRLSEYLNGIVIELDAEVISSFKILNQYLPELKKSFNQELNSEIQVIGIYKEKIKTVKEEVLELI